VQASGRAVTTIEGLAPDAEAMHPMQQAFRECHALQCGFCTPGMVMAAVSLVHEHESLTEDGVRYGIKGNLCRCTGYQNIVAAVMRAADATRATPIPSGRYVPGAEPSSGIHGEG
jgi:aerobic carbon-monoxide dehydrogenase small subunit